MDDPSTAADATGGSEDTTTNNHPDDLTGSLVSIHCKGFWSIDDGSLEKGIGVVDTFKYTGRVESRTVFLWDDGDSNEDEYFEDAYMVKFEIKCQTPGYADRMLVSTTDTRGKQTVAFTKAMTKRDITKNLVTECPIKLLQKHVGNDGSSSSPMDWDAFYADLLRVPELATITLPLHFPEICLPTLYWALIRPGCRPDIVQELLRVYPEGLTVGGDILTQCLFRPDGQKHVRNLHPRALQALAECSNPKCPNIGTFHNDVDDGYFEDLQIFRVDDKKCMDPIYHFLDNGEDALDRTHTNFSTASLTIQAKTILAVSWQACALLLMDHFWGRCILSDSIVDFCLAHLPGKHCFYTSFPTTGVPYPSQSLAEIMSKQLRHENSVTFRKYIAAFSSIPGTGPSSCLQDIALQEIDFISSVLLLKACSHQSNGCLSFPQSFLTRGAWKKFIDIFGSDIQCSSMNICHLACRLKFGWCPFLQDIVTKGKPSMLEAPDLVEGLPPFLFSATCDWMDGNNSNGRNSQNPRQTKRDKGILGRTYMLLRANPAVLEKAGEIGTDFFKMKKRKLEQEPAQQKKRKLG